MMWDDGHYYFGWPGMLLVMVVSWGLVGAAVYLGARWLGRDRVSSTRSTSSTSGSPGARSTSRSTPGCGRRSPTAARWHGPDDLPVWGPSALHRAHPVR